MKSDGRKVLHLRNKPYAETSSPIADICEAAGVFVDHDEPFDVDWSGVTFASVAQAASLACVQLCAKGRGVEGAIRSPNKDVRQYLERMDYFSTLGVDTEEGFSRHETHDRFIPLMQVPIDENDANVNDVAVAIRKLLARTMSLSQGARERVDFCVGEIIDNVVQHSQASAPGIVGAQYYPQVGYADICIADGGVGIAKTMAENPAYRGLTDDELLMKAFEHRTGQWFENAVFGTNRVSAGEGLASLAETVCGLGGHVWVVSRETSLEMDKDGPMRTSGLTYPGTVIVIRVPNIDRSFPEWEGESALSEIGLW